VADTCNPSYSGDRDPEDQGSSVPMADWELWLPEADQHKEKYNSSHQEKIKTESVGSMDVYCFCTIVNSKHPNLNIKSLVCGAENMKPSVLTAHVLFVYLLVSVSVFVSQ
jgi:hypothetical protein